MPTYRIFFDAMAARCEVHLAAPNGSDAQELAQFVINEVRRIEAKYSRYQPDSVVSLVAAQAGRDWVECDDETLWLLDCADTLFVKSGGLFDITSGVLRRAWNFTRTELPSEDALQGLCGLVDWLSVQRHGRHIRLPRMGMELDFGGFGKEYAADRSAMALANMGVKHGYVNLAGDIRVIGPQFGSQPWIIGIQDPCCRDKSIASIAVSNGALATSGDYERSFELDGKRYCHILHPKTGLPVSFWRSISVQAPSTLQAGSIATIAMLKQDQGLAFLDNENVVYAALDQDGTAHYNKGSPL